MFTICYLPGNSEEKRLGPGKGLSIAPHSQEFHTSQNTVSGDQG